MAAETGVTDTRIITKRNKKVLSSFAPLKIADLQWSIMAEMDLSEAYESITKLN